MKCYTNSQPIRPNIFEFRDFLIQAYAGSPRSYVSLFDLSLDFNAYLDYIYTNGELNGNKNKQVVQNTV